MNQTPRHLAESEVWLVDVAVPVPLRQSFTYQVPEDLLDAPVRAGHRVLAPFGPRLLHGVTLCDAYPGQLETRKPRALISYDAGQRVLSPDIQKLLTWIVDYYKGAVGEAVKLVLPPGILNEKEISFRLTKLGAAEIENPATGRILGLLQGKALTKKEWEAKAQAEIRFQDIREWEDRDWVKIVIAGGAEESVPHETVVALTPSGRSPESASLGRAVRQRELLFWLNQRPEELVPLKELNRVFSGGGALLARLIERGLCEKKRVPKHEIERGRNILEPELIRVLTSEQDRALSEIVQALDQPEYQAFLMFGVTGSGKTEVYLRAIQHCLAQGRQALFLVPEIALTPLMQRRIENRFGDRLAILHSAVGAGKRSESWARVLAGKVDVVLGARSGIFAPLPKLGLIIVDEEHDQSYKQNDGIRYQARDLAMVRGTMSQAVVVLGSATPSLESWRNYERGRCRLLTLKKRATKAALPSVSLVDMRREFQLQKRRPVLSNLLTEHMERTLRQNHQVMILINRRGYHGFLLCRKCGGAVMCSRCEVSLTYHQVDRSLKCHYCGETRPVPERCPNHDCGAAATLMQFFGEGTQQIQDLIQKRFPDVMVDRLDRDRLQRKNAQYEILARFERGETRVLVGTQMIAKGHDFPNVTLVGIVNADTGLRVPDFRGAELVFQLLTQVAGRSGRGKDPGSVVIQTYMPEHYSIAFAAAHDFPSFLERESHYRKHLFYPPFSYMVALLVTHRDEHRAGDVSRWMAVRLGRLQHKAGLEILGPAKAPIGKIKHAFRYQIILKSRQRKALHWAADRVVEEVVREKLLPRQAIIFDIDPYQFF